jgi:hypothetical protein
VMSTQYDAVLSCSGLLSLAGACLGDWALATEKSSTVRAMRMRMLATGG